MRKNSNQLVSCRKLRSPSVVAFEPRTHKTTLVDLLHKITKFLTKNDLSDADVHDLQIHWYDGEPYAGYYGYLYLEDHVEAKLKGLR